MANQSILSLGCLVVNLYIEKRVDMSKRFSPIAFSLCLALLGSTVSSITFGAEKEQPGNDVLAQQEAAIPTDIEVPEGLPLEELRRFSEVFESIKRAYVEPVSDKKLLEDAARGMLIGLDPHSSYLAQDDYSELQIQTAGEFGGVGIEVSQEDGVIRVITPMDGTPAMKAGIKPGDIIIKIDGEIIQSIGVDKAVSMMRGEPGSEIILTIGRDGKNVPFDVSLKRELISVSSISHRYLEQGLGYIRVSQFQHHSARDLKDALSQLQQDDALKGLVIDLRNNPGGLLSAAVDISDAFIDSGTIVSTKGREANSSVIYGATKALAIADIPIIVVINGGSASASEIVAGALQDTKRAIILGTTSFGKGSVQTVVALTGDRAIKLTTAKYYTPSGRSIQAQGIVPDIVVEQAHVEENSPHGFRVKEKDLAGHLENAEQETAKVASNHLLETDFQLHEAVNLLKGLTIYQSIK